MYTQSHLKRILPKKDEHGRIQFPTQYYSTSSLYSYSPTTSTDCPEHGSAHHNHHQRTKIILTVAVLIATVGVLSIGGIALYLGFLSKSLHHSQHDGGSLSEESYLYSTVITSKSTDDEETIERLKARSRSHDISHLSNAIDHHHIEPDNDSEDVTTKQSFNHSILRNKLILTSSITFPPSPVDLQSSILLLRKNISTTYPGHETTDRITAHFDPGDRKHTQSNQITSITTPYPLQTELNSNSVIYRSSPNQLIGTAILIQDEAITTKPMIDMEINSAPSQDKLNSSKSSKIHLTFDRVSPDMYDKKPWTPLLISHDHLPEKRPRTDTISTLSSSQNIPQNIPNNEENIPIYDVPIQLIESTIIRNETNPIEDYDDENENDSIPIQIYSLDPNNMDMVPIHNYPNITQINQNISTTDNHVESTSRMSDLKLTAESDIKSTTDFILSTLGNLNLVKMKSTDLDVDRNMNEPLFPPTRSYVSVNLPLRPKPLDIPKEDNPSRDQEKIYLVADEKERLRLLTGQGQPLAPHLTSTSSISKVLSSIMMNYQDTTTNQNVLQIPSLNDTNNGGHRGHKSISRDPKIDSEFKYPETTQVQVPLSSPNKTWIPTKLTSFTINQNNSPVYKFILRKGQSVEDLLKEIFHNFTNKKNTTPILTPLAPTTTITTTTQIPTNSSIQVLTTTAKIQDKFLEDEMTTNGPIFTQSSFLTSTSVVITNDIEKNPSNNSTFKCLSNGLILSAFARCNSIKECPDNSDEKNCKCIDYLKSQLLHRKICDGIVDCADESDEHYCEWCIPGQYICSGSRSCIERDRICDSRRDCPRGDDESNCVKIGSMHIESKDDLLEDISPIYHQEGYLMVRKKGIWGKLCVETFSTVLSHWEIKDLARAVCKAKTFTDFESVEKVKDEDMNEDYFELYNENEENEESPSKSSIGFKLSQCKTKMVIKVKCQDLQCGTAPRAFTQVARYPRIVGGSNAIPGGWPWQAALYRDGEYQCGATLISSQWLLSAGHCFYHAQDDYWVARLGTLRRGASILSPYEQVIRITHIFLHPQYKDIGFINDVSLLRLEKEVTFTDFVRPVCLPDKETQIKDGRICTVVGWGQLFETGRVFPDTLQEVQLPLISTTECRKRTLFLPLYKLTDQMFCAGFDRGGRDACLGDSGGPLMCPENDGRWSLYGVTSNGYGCARANRPGVYTKTKRYLDWVYDKMSQHVGLTYNRDKTKPCPGHRCLLGECLEPRSLCNGITECSDGSDERNCTWS